MMLTELIQEHLILIRKIIGWWWGFCNNWSKCRNSSWNNYHWSPFANVENDSITVLGFEVVDNTATVLDAETANDYDTIWIIYSCWEWCNCILSCWWISNSLWSCRCFNKLCWWWWCWCWCKCWFCNNNYWWCSNWCRCWNWSWCKIKLCTIVVDNETMLLM